MPPFNENEANLSIWKQCVFSRWTFVGNFTSCPLMLVNWILISIWCREQSLIASNVRVRSLLFNCNFTCAILPCDNLYGFPYPVTVLEQLYRVTPLMGCDILELCMCDDLSGLRYPRTLLVQLYPATTFMGYHILEFYMYDDLSGVTILWNSTCETLLVTAFMGYNILKKIEALIICFNKSHEILLLLYRVPMGHNSHKLLRHKNVYWKLSKLEYFDLKFSI